MTRRSRSARAPASPASAPGSTRVALVAAAALCTAVVPVFLVAALGPQIQASLVIDEVGLGAALTTVFVTAGLVASRAGRLADERGAPWALRLGLVVSSVSALVVGATARSWWTLGVGMVLAGIAVALVDTGGARLFADRVPLAAQGSSFGVKEASVPAASLLAGLAVPAVAAFIDWRVAFLLAVPVPVLLLLALPSLVPVPPSDGGRPARRTEATPSLEPTGAADPAGAVSSVVPLAIAIGLAAAAANAAATFLVPSLRTAGVGAAAAGVVLSVASLASILARLGSGRWADRPSAVPGRGLVLLVAVGAAAAIVVATTGRPAVAAIGAVLTLGAGWGWTGLAFLVAVRARQHAAAGAAGTVLAGLALGGAVGPLGFGALVSRWSYPVGWTVIAAAFAIAGLGMAVRLRGGAT